MAQRNVHCPFDWIVLTVCESVNPGGKKPGLWCVSFVKFRPSLCLSKTRTFGKIAFKRQETHAEALETEGTCEHCQNSDEKPELVNPNIN